MKISANRVIVEIFNRFELPQWFRFFTGGIQIFGAIGIIAGIWSESLSIWVSLGIAIMMFLINLSHIQTNDSIKQMIFPFLIMVLSLIISILIYKSIYHHQRIAWR